jgi:hypothetical protein
MNPFDGGNIKKQEAALDFDLQQYPYCADLDIILDKPLLILKDRHYLDGRLEIDLGEIHITNYIEDKKGRWLLHP